MLRKINYLKSMQQYNEFNKVIIQKWILYL